MWCLLELLSSAAPPQPSLTEKLFSPPLQATQCSPQASNKQKSPNTARLATGLSFPRFCRLPQCFFGLHSFGPSLSLPPPPLGAKRHSKHSRSLTASVARRSRNRFCPTLQFARLSFSSMRQSSCRTRKQLRLSSLSKHRSFFKHFWSESKQRSTFILSLRWQI